MAQEVECWTLHLVGGVATTAEVWGLNPEEAGVSHLDLKPICGGVWINFHQNRLCLYDWEINVPLCRGRLINRYSQHIGKQREAFDDYPAIFIS